MDTRKRWWTEIHIGKSLCLISRTSILDVWLLYFGTSRHQRCAQGLILRDCCGGYCVNPASCGAYGSLSVGGWIVQGDGPACEARGEPRGLLVPTSCPGRGRDLGSNRGSWHGWLSIERKRTGAKKWGVHVNGVVLCRDPSYVWEAQRAILLHRDGGSPCAALWHSPPAKFGANSASPKRLM